MIPWFGRWYKRDTDLLKINLIVVLLQSDFSVWKYYFLIKKPFFCIEDISTMKFEISVSVLHFIKSIRKLKEFGWVGFQLMSKILTRIEVYILMTCRIGKSKVCFVFWLRLIWSWWRSREGVKERDF